MQLQSTEVGNGSPGVVCVLPEVYCLLNVMQLSRCIHTVMQTHLSRLPENSSSQLLQHGTSITEYLTCFVAVLQQFYSSWYCSWLVYCLVLQHCSVALDALGVLPTLMQTNPELFEKRKRKVLVLNCSCYVWYHQTQGGEIGSPDFSLFPFRYGS